GGDGSSRPLATSHSRTTGLPQPRARVRPSGENARQRQPEVFGRSPSDSDRSASPVALSCSVTPPSLRKFQIATAISAPSGLKARETGTEPPAASSGDSVGPSVPSTGDQTFTRASTQRAALRPSALRARLLAPV